MTEPLFPWLKKRSAGILLHPTSLPSDLGIGKFGRSARRFVDFLQAAGIYNWQMCPLGPTGYGDSPYQCFSAFAGNPYFIDLHALVGMGLLHESELGTLKMLPRNKVDYGWLYQQFWPVMSIAFERFHDAPRRNLPDYGDYAAFKKEHASWLDAHAAFQALKTHFDGNPWYQWPAKYRSLDKFNGSPLAKELDEQIEFHRFIQYVFSAQWRQLRAYANEKGISIIGDIPIFVAADSADVWANQQYFQLNSNGRPTHVAGVPPDYFSETGQLWGNPLYDWKALEKDGYQWWLDRIEANLALFDIVRLDHFRGFEDYWSIPADAKDARGGKWIKAPGLKFFKVLKKAFPDAKLIAEDLGEINDDVVQLLKDTGLPGMAILHYAFDGDAKNGYLPHNLTQNSVIYPGTHDNDTTRGWYASASQNAKDYLRRYFGVSADAVQWDLARAAYASTSCLAVIPLQDLMNLGTEARFNTPGKPAGNWQWRYSQEQLDVLWRESAAYLKELGTTYDRLNKL